MESAANDPWLMRIEDGMSAHFLQPTGASRPGIDWRIGLKRGEEIHTVMVRTYAADDLAPELKKDPTFLADTAMSYLNDLLNQGWHPSQPRHHEITVTNPVARPEAR